MQKRGRQYLFSESVLQLDFLPLPQQSLTQVFELAEPFSVFCSFRGKDVLAS